MVFKPAVWVRWPRKSGDREWVELRTEAEHAHLCHWRSWGKRQGSIARGQRGDRKTWCPRSLYQSRQWHTIGRVGMLLKKYRLQRGQRRDHWIWQDRSYFSGLVSSLVGTVSRRNRFESELDKWYEGKIGSLYQSLCSSVLHGRTWGVNMGPAQAWPLHNKWGQLVERNQRIPSWW